LHFYTPGLITFANRFNQCDSLLNIIHLSFFIWRKIVESNIHWLLRYRGKNMSAPGGQCFCSHLNPPISSNISHYLSLLLSCSDIQLHEPLYIPNHYWTVTMLQHRLNNSVRQILSLRFPAPKSTIRLIAVDFGLIRPNDTTSIIDGSMLMLLSSHYFWFLTEMFDFLICVWLATTLTSKHPRLFE